MEKIVFIILLLPLSLFAQNKMYWENNKKLSWEDFQQKPERSKVAALSYCGIQFYSCENSTRRNTYYRVRAFFKKDLSWVWYNSKKEYVLKHEQLHFDIAEIFARKMRKHFSENTVPIYVSRKIYDQYFEMYEAFQNQYDSETKHGTNDEKQFLWEKKIHDELSSLDSFGDDICY